MIELLGFLRYLIDLYMWVVIASVILSWLVNFGVVNAYNPFVRSLGQLFSAVTEPLLGPIRRALPSLGAIDISPIVLLVGLVGVRDFLIPFLMRMLAGTPA
ncbi:MAG: YggT family protein [Hyphomicrobium sp.]